VKSFSKQFKNTDMRHFKFHWELIYGKIFSNEYFPVISRIGPLIGIESTTPLIRAALNDLACDLSPVRNLQADRERVREKLQNAKSTEIDNLNKKRRDHVKYSVGDFVLLHRASRCMPVKLTLSI
jgi:hypothetical protein